jgi:uncharacterized Zn finger protein
MSRYYGGWNSGSWVPYVPVAERRRQAARAMAELRNSGHPVAPVTIAGRLIATTFWGRAWCDNMESYLDYESRLPRGRAYVRNGSVVDLQVASGRIAALVSGSDLYRVSIAIEETAKPHWRAICADCAGGIESVVELLQGRLSKGVMERLCRQEGGLFPRPADIRFSCSCPDHASMCKHVAAVLYGVGARLDHQPDLLFRLRAVDENDLVAGIDTALSLSKTGPAAGKVLETDDMAALFGLDMEAEDVPATTKPPAKSRTAAAGMQPAKSAPTKLAADTRNPVKPISPKAEGRRQTKTSSIAPSKTLQTPTRRGEKRQVTVGQPKQKPVKWW